MTENESVCCSNKIPRLLLLQQKSVACNSRATDAATDWWPPRIEWAQEMGWLRVRCPWTGQWFEVAAKEAPRGWPRIAQEEKLRRRSR